MAHHEVGGRVRVTLQSGMWLTLEPIDGGVRAALGPGIADASALLEVSSAVPRQPGWSLELESGSSLSWPTETTIYSSNNGCGFELTTPDGQRDEMLWAEGPFSTLAQPEFFGEGRELSADGLHGVIRGTEVDYVLEGAQWTRWSLRVPVDPQRQLSLYAQAPAARVESWRARVLLVAQSVLG
jgi:hypothetical protein